VSEHDAGLWAEAMDRAVALAGAAVQPTAEWGSRYDWNHVAGRVAGELGLLADAVSGSLR
jgi:hypothetical protein